MRPETSLPPDYFEGMFKADPDPWRFETSAYERAKYDRTIAALAGRRYDRALEVGCANGVLTRRLADLADALVALDVSDSALAGARARCQGLDTVSFRRATFPAEAPVGVFDLILLSEVVYYWSDADIVLAGRRIDAALAPGGDVLLVHWIGETDYPQTGDDAVAKLADAIPAPLQAVRSARTDRYRLDLWRRAP